MKILTYLLLLSFGIDSWVLAQNFPHIKVGAINYAGGYLKEPSKTPLLDWHYRHTDFSIGGPAPFAFTDKTDWIGYATIAGMYTDVSESYHLYTDLRDFCDSHGYDFAEMFIHMNRDFSVHSLWSGMDRFDAFDTRNGVLVDWDGVLFDKTNDAYNNTGKVTFNRALYLGYDLPFAEMNFDLSTFAVSPMGRWEYWNGSTWAEITKVTDGTNRFQADGKVSFIPPSSWKRGKVNGSRLKYFVRFTLSSASRFPVIQRVTGDNWLTGSKCRGWDPAAPGIVNTGDLAFNPNPPAGATAKFRHQAWVTGYWAPNQTFMNIAYKVDGRRPWADFRVGLYADQTKRDGYSGWMIDSLGGSLTLAITDQGNTPEVYSDFGKWTTNSWGVESLQHFKYFRDGMYAACPGVLIGGNTYIVDYANESDFIYLEYYSSPGWGGGLELANFSTTKITYDNYLPENNPKGRLAIFMLHDVIDYRSNKSLGAFNDRSNQGPMAALSAYYIGATPYTYLHYYSQGGWRYDEMDEIFVFSKTSTTLTEPLVVDTSAGTKTIQGTDFTGFPAKCKGIKIGTNVIITNYSLVNSRTLTTTQPIYYPASTGSAIRFVDPVADRMSYHAAGDYPFVDDVYRWANYFPAMFVDVGQPDPQGWNGGKRGRWNGLYRRDYTKCIVLHNAGSYATTKEQFDTYSAPYALGGSYAPLRADGRFGGPVTDVRLRPGEGAVLMKMEFTDLEGIPSSPRNLKLVPK